MAQKNKKDTTEPTGNDGVDGNGGDEFENAVTTAITGVMARAFGPDLYGPDEDVDDVEIIARDSAEDPPLVDDDPLEIGTVLSGRFEIVELVHAGGMSHVYKAIDPRRNPEGSGQVHVAIKMMRAAVAPEQDSRLALEREAARVQRLSHPNIVNVFDFDEHDGCVYLVMEWLDGESVNALLKRTGEQRLDQAFAWQVIEGAAAGVQHAHLNNVVHADINPSNLFITATHQIKLLDFGVARNCGDPADTEDNRLAWATKNYASPEVLSGVAPVVEDDMFSLGCVAYRLLAGSHPFPGTTSLDAMREDYEVPAIPGLPESHWGTIRRALDYRRTNRPKSAAVFYRATQDAPRTDVPTKPPERLWLWPAVAVAAAVVIIAGVLWTNRGAPTPDTPADTARVVTPVTEPPAPAEDAPPVEVSPVASLLDAAQDAFDGERYIAPPGDNARDYYREILTIDPANAAALRGLRSISDAYVREAEAALRRGSPAESAGALAIAVETDPGNPAIEIVDYLLVAEGNQVLARARAAATSGDVEQAQALLAEAEQYAEADAAEIAAIATILAERSDEAALLDAIDRFDQLVAEGSLLAPAGDNARDVLAALSVERGDDPRVVAAADRLGQRLLTDAALATATGDFDEAEQLLAATESLGVLDAEVERARAALLAAAAATQADADTPVDEMAVADRSVSDSPVTEGPVADSPVADSPVAEVAEAADDVAPAATTEQENVGSIVAPPIPANTSSAGSAASQSPAAETVAAAATAAADSTRADEAAEESAPVVRQSLSELGIERYVAPKFPRAARRRELSGFVEIGFVVNPDGSTGEFEIVQAVPGGVFEESAERAVSQWRFRERDEPVTARIMLSFEAD